MTDENKVNKNKELNRDKKNEANEEELQAWLDQVHFSSCCSDPLESNDNKKDDEICHITGQEIVKKK